MQDYYVLNDKEGIGIPAVHDVVVSMDTEQDNGLVPAQEFIYEKAKESCFLQASSTVGLPGSTINYDRNGFLIRTAPINWAVQKAVS